MIDGLNKRSSWGVADQTSFFASHSYFINEDDEIRNIQDPRLYFKYFISKNERHNERQRFAMNSKSPVLTIVLHAPHHISILPARGD